MARKMTDEQKEQARQNLAKAREAKKAKAAGTTKQAAAPEQPDQANPQDDPRDTLIATLMKRVDALEASGAKPSSPEAGIQAIRDLIGGGKPDAVVGNQGVQGVVRKYNIAKWELDRNYFPDPTDRLMDDPELKRFAMRENYLLTWEVTGHYYEDKQGVAYLEPKFQVELKRFPFEGEELPPNFPKGGKILVKRIILFEDEFVSRKAAAELGMDFTDDEKGFRDMMDEVRYQRLRTWLLEHFKPSGIQKSKKQTTPMAIGGTVLEVEESEKVLDSQGAAHEAQQVTRETQLTPAEREALGVQE